MTPNLPNPDLVKILQEHKCKVAYRSVDQNTFYLLINYDELVKNRPNQGFEIWGRNQEALDNIATTIRRYYPMAELSSQDAKSSVVYRLTGPGMRPVLQQVQHPQPEDTKPLKRR
jgi:hypothetical protein